MRINLKESLKQIEVNFIDRTLEKTKGNIARAARALTMSRSTLSGKIQKNLQLKKKWANFAGRNEP